MTICMKLAIFLLGQLLLVGGGLLSISKLKAERRIVTIWGFTLIAILFYMLIWYGPTSIFVVLGKRYVVEAQTHPWWLDEKHILPSLSNALVLQSLPLITTGIILSGPWPNGAGPWTRLEPLLGHISNLYFGLLGTVAQIITALLHSKSWLSSSFDFSLLPLWQKIPASGFFVLSIGPQLALFAYSKWNQDKLIGKKPLAFITLVSIGLGIFSFYAFGMRTYVVFEVLLLVLYLVRTIRLSTSVLTVLLPLILFLSFGLTSLHNRVPKQDSLVRTTQLVASNLVNGIAYRSGIANDSVILGSRDCVLQQLKQDSQQPTTLISMELASGLPKSLRDNFGEDLIDKRLERRVGQCYRDWLQRQDLKPDLSDSRIQYFLVALNPSIAPFVGSMFWILLIYSYLFLVCALCQKGLCSLAFLLPASAHTLALSDTPGAFVVFFKAAFPYTLLILLVIPLSSWVQRSRSFSNPC